MPHRGGRVAIFTAAQETLIVDMVHENNLIRLREIRDKVIADNVNFESIDDVSLATIDRVLRLSGVCVSVILLFLRPWVWRGLSTGMLSLGLTTPNVSSPS